MSRTKSDPFDVSVLLDGPAPPAPLPIAERVMRVAIHPFGNPDYIASVVNDPVAFAVPGSNVPGYRFACPACAGKAEITYGHGAAGPFNIGCSNCAPAAVRAALQDLAPLAFEVRDDVLFPIPDGLRDRVLKAVLQDISFGPHSDSGSALRRFRNLGGALSYHEYKGPDGLLLLLQLRADHEDGGKRFLPVHCTVDVSDNIHVECRFPNGLLPLYNWADLVARPDGGVLVVEGEKAAEAAREYFPDYVVVTSSCGAENAAMSDWSPLHDHDVVIWRDNDDAGLHYEKGAAAHAIAARACRVRRVNLPAGLPAKWDLADPLPEGVTVDDLRKAITTAVEVRWDDVKDGLGRSRPNIGAPLFRLPDGLFAHRKTLLSAAESALKHLNPGCRRGRWLGVLGALHHAFGEKGFEMADAWSRRESDKHHKYFEGEVRQIFDGFQAAPRDQPMQLLVLFRMAMKESRERSDTADGWEPDAAALTLAYVAEFDSRHRKIFEGDNVSIGIQEERDGRFEIRHLREKNAESLYLAKKAPNFDGSTTSIFKLWEHNQLVDPVQLVFKPGNDIRPGELNLFQGLDVRPIKGNGRYTLFREHLDRIAAHNGSEETFLWKIMAYRLQNLGRHVPCCLAFIGPEGGGKSTVTSVLARLLAPYSLALSDPEKFVGRNNACLQGKLMVQLEEMILGTNEAYDSRLKHYVTSHTIDLEDKYKSQWQAPNRLLIAVTSNKKSAIRITETSRRFAMYHVPDHFGGDQAKREEYFGRMWAELESGGLEALAYDLLQEDLAGFSPARVPKTGLYQEMVSVDADRDPLRGWLRERLESGELPETVKKDRSWEGPIPKRGLYDSYVGWCEADGPASKRSIVSYAEWAKRFGKMLPGGLDARREMREGKRDQVVYLPPHADCCDHFEAMFDCRLERAPAPAQLRAAF